MSVETEMLKLYRYEAADCIHHLLVRVWRPGASNADQGALDAADAFAESAAAHLRGWWERWRLPSDCRREHRFELVGEQETPPIGEVLLGPGLRDVQLWVAQTAYGEPWVVMGTATDEAEFWKEVAEDEGLSGLQPQAPARLHTAFLLSDRDGESNLSHPL